jgi:hypothetical protein
MWKILYIKGNPNFEYQRRNGIWYKRPIGTKTAWTKPDANGTKVLTSAFADKNALYYYSTNVFIGSAVVLGIVSFWFFKKRSKNAPII